MNEVQEKIKEYCLVGADSVARISILSKIKLI